MRYVGSFSPEMRDLLHEEGQALSPARSFDLLDLAAALVGFALFGRLGAIRLPDRPSPKAMPA